MKKRERELEQALKSTREMNDRLLLAYELEEKWRQDLEEQLRVLDEKYNALLKENLELLEKIRSFLKQ